MSIVVQRTDIKITSTVFLWTKYFFLTRMFEWAEYATDNIYPFLLTKLRCHLSTI
jgi:hypothetical protein